jgi:hypothetical protein
MTLLRILDCVDSYLALLLYYLSLSLLCIFIIHLFSMFGPYKHIVARAKLELPQCL